MKAQSPIFSQMSNKPIHAKPHDNYGIKPWRILVVDDEPEVHCVTHMVLRNFEFNRRPIEFLDADSAEQAKKILSQEKDIALCLIDVVMESDEAGLELVKYIRQELKDDNMRLVLRTGQPGYAPEKDVIRHYDINDYKDKTELTDIKLHTLMYSALRAYEDIMRLELNRQGLEMVIKASSDIFEAQSLNNFTSAVLMQLMSLMSLSPNALMVKVDGFSVAGNNGQFRVLAGAGEFTSLVGSEKYEDIAGDVREFMEQASCRKQSIYEEKRMVLYSETDQGHHHMLYLQHDRDLSHLDQRLIELFCGNVSLAYENLTLKQEIEETQREIVYRLGEAIENRSKESGNHIHRVASMCAVMAKAFGYSDVDVTRVKAAAPLHDAGKIGIPDRILHKAGKLDNSEWEIMKTHVDIGYQMLKNSNRPIINYASIIAEQHHERWDGKGYPKGLRESQIHLLGRIVAVVDVFDALTSTRCYKKAWPIDEALDYLQAQSGSQFDPQVVTIFMKHISEISSICERLAD